MTHQAAPVLSEWARAQLEDYHLAKALDDALSTLRPLPKRSPAVERAMAYFEAEELRAELRQALQTPATRKAIADWRASRRKVSGAHVRPIRRGNLSDLRRAVREFSASNGGKSPAVIVSAGPADEDDARLRFKALPEAERFFSGREAMLKCYRDNDGQITCTACACDGACSCP